VGVGQFGRHHLRVLQDLHRERRIELRGVVGRTPARARALGARFDVTTYRSLDAALRDGLDLVDIATPAGTHERLVRRCLPHAHVFVEKPLARTAAAGVRLYRVAARHRRRLGVGHIFRFNRAVARLRALVRSKGRPHAVRIELTGWAAKPPRDVGAVATYLHVFDVLDQLLGEPPLSSECLGRSPSRGREAHALLALRYRGGLTAVAEVGWIGGVRRRRLEVAWPRLSVSCDLAAQTMTLDRPGRAPRTLRVPGGEPLRDEIVHFLHVLRGHRGPRPAPAEVLRVLRLVDDAKASWRTGRAVRWRG
jgi:UDP-N-acetylglucosamine 3-dehydrogenase